MTAVVPLHPLCEEVADHRQPDHDRDDHRPGIGHQGLGSKPGNLIAAEIERDDQRRGDKHGHIFTHEEQGKLHRAVLDVVAGDDLTLAFSQVERRPVGFGEGGDDEDDDPQRLQHESPHGDKAEQQSSLKLGHFSEIYRAVDGQQADQRQAHGNLVADHLGGSPQSPQYPVLVVGRPAGQDNAVDPEADHGQKPEDADIHRKQSRAVIKTSMGARMK